MKKGALFFDCFYSFSSLLSPLSLSRLTILSSKINNKLVIVKNNNFDTFAFNRHLNAILFFILYKDYNFNNFNSALRYAAKGGHLDLCKYLIKLGATHFNWALANAAEGSHLDICKYFIKIGATAFNDALACAAKGGHLDLCHYFINLGANDFNRALEYAAYGGHLDLCKYFIKLGATNFDWALASARNQTTKDFFAGLIQAQK